MTMLLRLGGEWKTISGAKVYANSAWRTLVAIQVYAGGQWRPVANFTPPSPPAPGGGGGGGGGSMSLAVTPTSDNPVAFSSTVTSDYLTATPSGGLAPYTYTWTITSHDTGASFNINTPSSANTTVTATGVPLGVDKLCTVQCTARDSLGVSATSNAVTIDFFHESRGQ